jgi:hypothetical protein
MAVIAEAKPPCVLDNGGRPIKDDSYALHFYTSSINM